jgi:hypothetical protein
MTQGRQYRPWIVWRDPEYNPDTDPDFGRRHLILPQPPPDPVVMAQLEARVEENARKTEIVQRFLKQRGRNV